MENKDGELVSDDARKANVLNEFFASVFTQENSSAIPIFDIKYNGVSVIQVYPSRDKLLKDLKSLNISKSMGHDGWDPRILKETADIICDPLLTISKKSFDSGEMPVFQVYT